MLRKKHLLFFVVLTVVANSWLAPLFAPSGNEEAPAQGLPKPPQQKPSSPSSAQDPVNATPLACAAPHTQSFEPTLLHATLQGTSDLAPTAKPFPLFSLPEELWQLILDFTYEEAFDEGTVTEDWKNLRLTCRTINQHVTNEAFFKCAKSHLSDIDDITRFVTPCPLKPLIDVFLTNVTLSPYMPEILLHPHPKTLKKNETDENGILIQVVPYTAQDIASVATLKKTMHERPAQFTLQAFNPTYADIKRLPSFACPINASFKFHATPCFELLATLKNLTKLTLGNNDIITSLGDLSPFTALEELEIIAPPRVFAPPAHASFVANHPELLALANPPTDPQTLEAIGMPPNLKTIVVANFHELTDISHLLKLPKLQNITIDKCYWVPPEQVAALKAHIAARDAMASNS